MRIVSQLSSPEPLVKNDSQEPLAVRGSDQRIAPHEVNFRSSRRSVLLAGILATASYQKRAHATPYKEANNIQYGLLNGYVIASHTSKNPLSL